MEVDRRRLKRESETCKFEDKGEKMRDPLARLYKPRRRTAQKQHQMRRKARNLRIAMDCMKPTDKAKKKPSKNQRTAKRKAAAAEAARRGIIPPWRKPHDDDYSCSGFRKDELCVAECSSTEELHGETYKRRKLSGTAPRFETIYVPALPNVRKEKVGGDITPTEPCEDRARSRGEIGQLLSRKRKFRDHGADRGGQPSHLKTTVELK